MKMILFSMVMSVPTALFAADEVAFEDVPEVVMETAISTAPDLDFKKVSVEIEDGVKVYEFEAMQDGKRIEVDVLEDGTLDEVEMETAYEDVPETVRLALAQAYPDFSPSFIETSVRADGVFVYEFTGTMADGTAKDIEVGEDGAILSVSATNSE